MFKSRFKNEEWEPDPEKLCDKRVLAQVSKDKAELIACEKLADYRVLVSLDTRVLCEGGIASNLDDWETQMRIEYWCMKHFKELYHTSAKTPKMTFRRIKRP